jgi:hypothetical protein
MFSRKLPHLTEFIEYTYNYSKAITPIINNYRLKSGPSHQSFGHLIPNEIYSIHFASMTRLPDAFINLQTQSFLSVSACPISAVHLRRHQIETSDVR